MKRLKRWLLPVFTLLLVAAGAAMPFAAAYMQDAQEAGSEVWAFDSFSLTLQKQGADLGRLLRAIADGAYYINETPQMENTALTRGLALAAAEDLMTKLTEFGLLEKEALAELFDPRVYPQLVVPVVYSDPENEEDADAAAAAFPDHMLEGDPISTWTVTWEQPDDCYVWLDDASGRAVLIEVPGPFYPEGGSSDDREPLYARAENWRTFLEDYYGVEVQIAGEEWYDSAVQYTLSFSLGTGKDQENFQLSLYMYFRYGFTTLNPYS